MNALGLGLNGILVPEICRFLRHFFVTLYLLVLQISATIFLQINARQNPQIHIQAKKQERRTLECRKKGGGGSAQHRQNQRSPTQIPILPLNANAITRHQSKYINFRHIDVVSSL